jgi:hypothetical protein
LTEQEDADFVAFELRHRLHARGEDRIQESQALGLGRLPFRPTRPTARDAAHLGTCPRLAPGCRSPGSGRPAVLALSSVLAIGVFDVAAGRGIAVPREL